MSVLGDKAYPFLDDDGETRIMDPDTGQKYEVDPNSGGAILPDGSIDYPDWVVGRGQPSQTPGPDMGLRPRGNQPSPSLTPYQPSGGYSLPPLNVQPGMPAQQWEATYNLSLAEQQRLRDQLEKVGIPQARAGIDQMLADIKQKRFGNLMGQRESQAQSTGLLPRYLPKAPSFQPGGWQQYQGAGVVGQGPGPAAGNEDAAAQAIWNNDSQMQQMYKANHPDWTPIQSVKDWWSNPAVREGAASLTEYAQKKGWLKGA